MEQQPQNFENRLTDTSPRHILIVVGSIIALSFLANLTAAQKPDTEKALQEFRDAFLVPNFERAPIAKGRLAAGLVIPMELRGKGESWLDLFPPCATVAQIASALKIPVSAIELSDFPTEYKKIKERHRRLNRPLPPGCK